MNLKRRWFDGSTDDLRSARTWYNDKLEGLGAEFVQEVFAVTAESMKQPFVLRVIEPPGLPTGIELRKVQLDRFKDYGVIYMVVEDQFVIVAVPSSRQEPWFWLDRLKP